MREACHLELHYRVIWLVHYLEELSGEVLEDIFLGWSVSPQAQLQGKGLTTTVLGAKKVKSDGWGLEVSPNRLPVCLINMQD